MTDEHKIREIIQTLEALESGDETARERLPVILGDVVDGDVITVGDISGATAIAIGSDIRVTIRQTDLPEELVSRLISLADALDRRAESTFEARGHIRVFLSSPGDVGDERKLAMRAISQLQNDPLYKEKITIEAVAWDKPDDSTPLLASIDPQTAINNGLARPSECDIVVVILWARMGTPLDHSRYQKTDGSQYLSGTEWEFEEALAAAQETGIPFVIVYRRTETPKVDLDDPELDQKIIQHSRVKAFFDSFINPDGSIRQGYNAYETPSEFGDIFGLHLRKLVARLIDEGQRREEKREVGIDTVNIVPPAEWPPGLSPFPGLRAFGPEDAPVYFGRGVETDKLIKRLSEPDCRVLAVVGASGSGKSSLVGAGLIPRLAENAIEGSKDWPVVFFTPDEWGVGDPFDSLAGALIADPLRLNPRGLAQSLREQPGTLRDVLTKALGDYPEWAKVLVFVDQFEELFTRVHDEDLRRVFAAMLAETAKSPRIKIVITMRADFFHRVAELPALAALLKAHENRTFPLSAPGAIELYEMITGPARVAGLQFESGLAQQILYDTGDDPGALALMAYALQQLYEESTASDGWLTWAAYEGFGKVQGAIGEQAKDAFEQLSEEAQQALPLVFRELVEVDERGTATRKRAPLEVVTHGDPTCEELVRALTDARLLMASGGEYPVVEVAHEALFRSWPRLKTWVEEAQDDLILLRQVRHATQEWAAHEFNPGYLWPEERLKPVYAMIDRLQPQLTDLEQAFIRSEFDRLMDEVNDPTTTQQRRSAIGERLAAIGDRRPGVGLVTVPLPPPTDPREVRFWGEEHEALPDIVWLPMSGIEEEIEFRDDDDNVYGTFSIEPFHIAKYPITYIQFQAFIDDGGYESDEWWRDLSADASHRRQPGTQRAKFANYPRDTVSWYDAVAFTRWLSARTGIDIRLPTEWEWQFAATGGDPSFVYPWGPEFDSALCNTSEGGPGRTTAVGMYPLGTAPSGALDMSGNVWERCLNEHDNPKAIAITGTNTRVVRGGACYSDAFNARAACRIYNLPLNRYDYSGFRVVCGVSSPIQK